MKSGIRLALTVWLALATCVWLSAPSFAQKNQTAALTARITELSRAGKYSDDRLWQSGVQPDAR